MISIPQAALTQHIAVLGKTGSGKTYAMRGIVEGLLDAGARVCIVDPTGAWYGLRTLADGKRAGYPVAIFGGNHADFPLQQHHGEEIAEIIGTTSTPAIIDVSLMRTGERTRFFTDFAEGVLRKNRGPLHLILDEAHLFAPQGRVNDPQSGAMLHAANNLVSLGRSRGLRVALITQRPAKLHKDSLTQVETLVAMRLIAPQDRKAVEEWIKDNADADQGRAVLSSLATLKTGQGWVWSPELGILDRIAFPRIKTLDSGRAPDGRDIEGKALAEIDRDAIAAKLKTVAAEADANDPKKLMARIREMEQQAARKPAGEPQNSRSTAELQAAQSEGYQRGVIDGRAEGWRSGHQQGWRDCEEAHAAARSTVLYDAPLTPPTLNSRAAPQAVPNPAAGGSHARGMRNPVAMPVAAAATVRTPSATSSSSDLLPVQQRILNSLAELEQRQSTAPARELVAFMAGYSNLTSKGFANAMSALSSAGQITYPQQGFVALTDAGRRVAVPPARPTSAAELQQRVIEMVGGAAGRILQPLIDAYPGVLTREALAEAAGYGNLTSKGFANAMSRLSGLGFLHYPQRGQVAAKPVLFLEGS